MFKNAKKITAEKTFGGLYLVNPAVFKQVLFMFIVFFMKSFHQLLYSADLEKLPLFGYILFPNTGDGRSAYINTGVFGMFGMFFLVFFIGLASTV